MEMFGLKLYGCKCLHEKCEDFAFPHSEAAALADMMVQLLYQYGGVGLAGPQIGVMKNVIVWDAEWLGSDRKPAPRKMFNPRIVEESPEDILLYEGCLSLPEVVAKIYRSREVKVRYQTASGSEVEEWFGGVPARIIQHEIDHLNGVLVIDRMTPSERVLIAGTLNKIRKENNDAE